MSENEIAKLRREIAELRSQLSEVRSHQAFKTDFLGNVYDRNDNLVRDGLGNLYSGGSLVRSASCSAPEPFHSDNEDTYYYPSGMAKEEIHRENGLESRTTFFPNGQKQMEEETIGVSFSRTEFYLNGRKKSERFEENGHVTETHYFEDGSVMTDYSD